MASQIELDDYRVAKYQFVKNNLAAVEEKFRHGDILIKEINQVLEDIKNDIDNNIPTSFTKQDFNDILELRNTALLPIMQNASFAKEFPIYILDPDYVPPVVDTPPPTPEVTSVPTIINGMLADITTTTKVGIVTTNTTKTSFINGTTTEIYSVDYGTNETVYTITKYGTGLPTGKTVTTVSGNDVRVSTFTFVDEVETPVSDILYQNGVKSIIPI